MRRELLAFLAMGILAGVPLWAQENTPPDEAKKDERKDQAVRRKEEVTVVSASRVESTLVDAPATMSVLPAKVLELSAAQDVPDALRNVPGMNVIQTSARDFNLSTRQATSTLANSQLVLVDGRSVYLDFFGLVLWDFVPSPGSDDIKQIEVVRGPVSVVWGANALSGVVNIITKSPRESPGFGLSLNAGLFNRDGGSRESEGSGASYGGNFSYAGIVNDTWSYKLSAGYFNSDAYSRPVGTVPLDCHPLGVAPCRDANGNALPGGFPLGGAPFPAETPGAGNFPNAGTSQPKADLRFDQQLSNGGRITYQGGYAGTDGIIHTGIGPFDIQSGSDLAYGRVHYEKGAMRFGAFGNFLDASAPNLLLQDPESLPPEGGVPSPVVLGFKTQTYDVEFANTSVVAERHAITYGGNYRRNNFDITLAPDSKDRNEFGAYLQDEYFVSRFRIAAGVRADKFGNLARWVWSPRVSVMFKPTDDQSIRATYNRAFRSPSVINNYLSQNISNPTPINLCQPVAGVPVPCPLAFLLDQQAPGLGSLVPRDPFLLTVNNFGNPNLKEEHVDALELAYTGTFGRTTLGLSIYQNDIDNNINFTTLIPDAEYPQGLPGLEFYDASNPARGVVPIEGQPGAFRPITLNPILMGALAQVPPALGGPIVFPSKVATYLNLGPIRNRGIEASLQHRVNDEISFFGNYSFQDTPEILDAAPGQIRYPIKEVGIPARNRFNLGLDYDGQLLFGRVDVNYSDKALWTDVLGAEYQGYTDSFTMLNATLGVRFADGKVSLSLRGTNLTNEKIQQHIYGDLIRRSIVAEVRFFGR
jgi:outer membrane receptor protein involved in Fe transport